MFHGRLSENRSGVVVVIKVFQTLRYYLMNLLVLTISGYLLKYSVSGLTHFKANLQNVKMCISHTVMKQKSLQSSHHNQYYKAYVFSK